MRIRMKVNVSGSYWLDQQPHDWPARGEEGDVPDEEGARLCALGMAEPVAVVEVERAVAPEPEKRRAPGRPRKDAS